MRYHIVICWENNGSSILSSNSLMPFSNLPLAQIKKSCDIHMKAVANASVLPYKWTPLDDAAKKKSETKRNTTSKFVFDLRANKRISVFFYPIQGFEDFN